MRNKRKLKSALIGLIILVMLMLSISFTCAELSDMSVVSVSLVNQDPDPVTAGEIVEIRLGVENQGGESSNNLIVELEPTYPFEMVPGESAVQKVGTINGYQYGDNMKIIKYKIRIDRDATADQYDLKVSYYEEGSTSKKQTRLAIDVGSSEGAEVIYIDKTVLIPGKESSMTFTVNNVGNAPLREMTFNWLNEDEVILPVGSDNTKHIKYIDVGKSADLEYNVIADTNAEPGLYKLDLYLKYNDPISGEQKQISTIAGVYVGGQTDFDVAFSESSSGETSFSVANIGSNPAYSVSVMIPNQDGWRVSGSNTMIIGNLNNGDYTVASFSLQSTQSRGFNGQNSTASRESMLAMRNNIEAQNTIKVQIAYTDTMGIRKIVEKEVTLNPQAMMSTSTETGDGTSTSSVSAAAFRARRQPTFWSQYKWYIIGLILAVLLFVGYRKYRKEKLLNKNFRVRDLFRKKKR